ncbi:MAG TPA: hypothetical protein VIK33_10635 [Anaerolineae bacterium]
MKSKPAAKPAAPTVRPGTREYRDAQRAEFNKRFESAKKGRK